MRVLLFFLLFYVNNLFSTIHVIGDSHSGSFKNINNCIIHHIGPITMHRVGRDGLNILNLQKLGIKENDIVIFTFGEIDVRCHIGKQRDEKKRDLNEIIDTLVKNYINTINLNKKLYNKINCVIYLVVPPTNRCNNKNFPFYGTINDRINITNKLNSTLSVHAKKNDLYVLNIYALLHNKKGLLEYKLSDKCVHVAQSKNYLIKKGLIKLLKSINPSID